MHEVGTGAFVVVDSEDILHISPHLSGGLAQRPWWLKCVVEGVAWELRGPPGEEARKIWRGLLLLGGARERKYGHDATTLCCKILFQILYSVVKVLL